MPPKRRNRQSTPHAASNVKSAADGLPPPNDSWTDEQEAILFKSMLTWKPVGMHKHFRMIAITEHLQNRGQRLSDSAHIRPKGIWEKLGQLYNLEQLDIQEDTSSPGSYGDNTKTVEHFCDFELPSEEYLDRTFERRLALERPSSPTLVLHQYERGFPVLKERQLTIDGIDEPHSSPASIRGGRGTRGRGKRASHLAELARKGRRESKISIDDSVDGDKDNDDFMDVDTKAGAITRRSGRNR